MTFRLYLWRPWKHRPDAFGIILVVRHPFQQDREILQSIKIVCRCCKCKAVYNRTGSCPVYRIMEEKILPSNDVGSCSILRCLSSYVNNAAIRIYAVPLMGFASSYRANSIWIPGVASFTCSVGKDATGSKSFYGKVMVFCSFTNGWRRRAVSAGHGIRTKSRLSHGGSLTG